MQRKFRGKGIRPVTLINETAGMKTIPVACKINVPENNENLAAWVKIAWQEGEAMRRPGRGHIKTNIQTTNDQINYEPPVKSI